ncbi:MAG: hypothetical protein IJ593_05235 [Lachnospiraceae bacterium]|nr:hypothetical protein [Lachnospiraceae bacterium]
MTKNVKTIFLVLIGTAILIVVSSLLIEMINISLYSVQLQSQTKLACDKALELFSQESYKDRGNDGGTVKLHDVYTSDGSTYIDGRIYGLYTDTATIYNKLYRDSSEFQAWLDDFADNWTNVRILNDYRTKYKNMSTWSLSNLAITSPSAYSEYLIGKTYEETFVTPLNFGVPYIDKDIANNIFKWNLASLLSNSNPASVVKDENGRYCIEIRGFRIYASEAKIVEINYKVYDLNKIMDKKKFEDLTYIDAENLSFDENVINIQRYIDSTATGDERKMVCLVGVKYTVPVSYTGITPLKSIFEWVWTNQVNGLNASDYNTLEQQYYNYDIQELVGGGFDGSYDASTPGVLPVNNRLIFYVVR